MPQIALPSLEAVVTLDPCQAPPPVSVVTTAAPVGALQSLYLAAADCLYAIHAADGTARWCQRVKLIRTREVRYPPGMSYPPPPRVGFATPRVVGGVPGAVYVCIGGFGEYTCAFTADDGSLRWWTPTDARVAAMPFMDWAVPLVQDGVVYSGTYALDESDGSVRWHIEGIDTLTEGALALHGLVDETLYATTHRGIYAINAQDGQIRWLYRPDEQTIVSGPPVVPGRLLFAGTSGSVGHAEKSYSCALDIETGAEAAVLARLSSTRRSMSAQMIAPSTPWRGRAAGCAGNTSLPRRDTTHTTQPPLPMTSSTSLSTESMRSAARMAESSGTSLW